MEIVEVSLVGDAVKDAAVSYGLQPGAMHRSVSLLGVQCTLHFEELPISNTSTPTGTAPHVLLACFYLLSPSSSERLKQIILPQLQTMYPGTDIMLLAVPTPVSRIRATSPTRADRVDSPRRGSATTNLVSNNSAPISLARARQFTSAISNSEKSSETRPPGRDRRYSSDTKDPLVGFQEITFATTGETAPLSTGSEVLSSDHGSARVPSVSSIGSFADTPVGSDKVVSSSSLAETGFSLSMTSTSPMVSSSSFSSGPSSIDLGSPVMRWRTRHQPSMRNLAGDSSSFIRPALERAQELAQSLGLPLLVAPEYEPHLFTSPPGSFSSASVPPQIAALISTLSPSTSPSPPFSSNNAHSPSSPIQTNASPAAKADTTLSPNVSTSPRSMESSPHSPLKLSGSHMVRGERVELAPSSVANVPNQEMTSSLPSSSTQPNDSTLSPSSTRSPTPSIDDLPIEEQGKTEATKSETAPSHTTTGASTPVAANSPPATEPPSMSSSFGSATHSSSAAPSMSSSPISGSNYTIQTAAIASQVISFFEMLASAYQPPWLKQAMGSYKKLGLDISIPDKKTIAMMDVWRKFYQKGSDHVTNLILTDLGFKSSLPDFISQLTNLQTINLSGNNLNESHIKLIFQLPHISVLNLSKNQLKQLPDEIGRLAELTELDISFNHLETLPSHLGECTQLTKLDVSNNQLIALPFSLAKAPIAQLLAHGNGFAAIPLRARIDPKAIMTYLQQMNDKPTERWSRLRLMVVGPENIGKTRLVRRLSRREYSALSTDGIEVETFKLKLSGKSKPGNDSKLTSFEVKAYDFGGQEVFYPTHSFFIGPRSLYIAVFKLMADIESINWQSLEYWLRTIKLLANSESGKPSVIVVGTHLDEFESRAPGDQQREILNAITKRVQGLDNLVHIRNVCFLSNKSKKGIDSLRLAILARAEREEVLRQPIPASWVAMDAFLNCLIERNTFVLSGSNPTSTRSSSLSQGTPSSSPTLSSFKDSVAKSGSREGFFSAFGSSSKLASPLVTSQALRFISWHQFQEYAQIFNINGDEEVREMATFLHDMGSILWYNSTMMKDVVILDPQWLSEVMASIISMKVRWKDGELPHAALSNVWKAYPSKMHATLLSFLEHFEVAYPLKGTDKTIVPCMFNDEPADVFKAEMAVITQNSERAPKFQRKYRFKGFLPLGFFDRMIVRIMHISGLKLTSSWRYGIIMRMGSSTGSVTFDSPKKLLLVSVLARSTQDILFPSLLDSIESLIKTSYRNIKVTRRVLTTAVSVLQPDEFDYDVVLDAFHRGERTFMCGKVAVPIEDMAPDICMNFIPELKNVKVGDVIGRGGFGVVYRGTWGSAEVAVKEVLFKSALSSANTEAFRQFAHEVWIMSKLSHPNLVHLHGITLHPLRMIMELCPGMDLCNFLFNNPKIPVEPQYALLRLRIAIDVAKGMQHLHNLSPPVIHRDLRSPNVFVVSADDNAETIAKIGDFGLAEFTAHGLNEALPTWQWLPPETFNAIGNFKYNERCDRWSFGIVMWEIFTGKEPYSEYFDEPRFLATSPEPVSPRPPAEIVAPPAPSIVIEPSQKYANIIEPSSPREIALTLAFSNASLSSPESTSLTGTTTSETNSFANSMELPVEASANTALSSQASPSSPRSEAMGLSSDASLLTPNSSLAASSSSISAATAHTNALENAATPKLEKRPSRGATLCNVQNLKTAISHEGLRPTIPSHVPHSVKELMARCWHADPNQRPDFGEILSVLLKEAGELGLESAVTIAASAPQRSNTSWRATAASQRANYFRQPITRTLHSTIPLESGVLSMAYNPARTEIWSGCSDGNVRIFNCKTRIRNVEVHPVSNATSSNARIHQLLYVKRDNSPRLWSVSDRIVVWNPESRLLEKELFAPHSTIVRSMLYIESKQQVWTADVNGFVCIWDVNSYALLKTVVTPELNNAPIFCMTLVDDVNVWMGSYSKIIVIDSNTHQVLDSWEAHSGYRIMAMTLVGSNIWTGSELRICVWDKESRKQLVDSTGAKVERLIEFGVVSMITVKRSNELTHVWSGDSNGTVTVWNSDLSKPTLSIYQVLNNHKKDSVHAILNIDDGATICTGSYGNPLSKTKDNSICLWQYD